MHSPLALAIFLAAGPIHLEETVRDERVACARPSADLDGDGRPDLGCITRRADDEPQRVVVVLASSPEVLALDVPLLACPRCGGALGLSVEVDAVPGMLNVRERGGSREEWTRGISLAYRAGAFQIVGESYTVVDRASTAEVETGTTYQAGTAQSHRILRPGSGEETSTAAWLDLYAIAEGRSARADAPLSAPRVAETVVDRADYVIEGDGSWSSPDDLSFVVQVRESGSQLRMRVEVKDDDVQVAGASADHKTGDRVELWWDRGGDPWRSDFKPKLGPSPATTTGVVIELRPGGKARVTRLFPPRGDPPDLSASWKRTSSGYAVDLLAERRLFEGPSNRSEPGTDGTVVNFAVIVRDADAGEARETAMATSKLQHRGAPFEMGWLHLGSRRSGGQNRPRDQAPR
jgi:hypothetical protein